ncbi:ATP-dependent nuclease [Mycolicibacter sinensis]
MHIKIRNFRSFIDDHEFPLDDGVNYFVGPNNCGKSNLISAVELALDANKSFEPTRDRPSFTQGGVGKPRVTRITLTFKKTDDAGPQETLLRYAKQYERALRKKHNRETRQRGRTYAEDGEIRRVVTFGADGARQVSYEAKGLGAVSMPVDSKEHQNLERQFLKVVRFVVLHSGEDLRSVLSGQFREVLQLVIKDHLANEQRDVDDLRDKYVDGLKLTLLGPLRDKLQNHVSAMFPEVQIVDLHPEVRTLDETLSSVGIELGDSAMTELTGKGTGVRGAVLIAMLQYLAEQGKRSLVLAVEEPEAFLHPGAQTQIANELERLAIHSEVSLLVTTHSPHIISRSPNDRITELEKNSAGQTSVAATASGDDDRAELLGSLFTDSGLARILERATSVPTGVRGVVVVEGYTDETFLRYGLEAAARLDLIEDLHFISANGAKDAVIRAVLTSSATSAPVIVILDHDEHGRTAAETLVRLNWRKNEGILTLKEWPGKCRDQSHDIEIEDLIPVRIARKISKPLGIDAYDSMLKCGTRTHYRYSHAWKNEAVDELKLHLRGENCSNFVWLAEEINRRIEFINDRRERSRNFKARSEISG